jgi:hypothetical protein
VGSHGGARDLGPSVEAADERSGAVEAVTRAPSRQQPANRCGCSPRGPADCDRGAQDDHRLPQASWNGQPEQAVAGSGHGLNGSGDQGVLGRSDGVGSMGWVRPRTLTVAPCRWHNYLDHVDTSERRPAADLRRTPHRVRPQPPAPERPGGFFVGPIRLGRARTQRNGRLGKGGAAPKGWEERR